MSGLSRRLPDLPPQNGVQIQKLLEQTVVEMGALDALPVIVDESLDVPQKLSARSFLEVRWVTDHLQPHWVFEKCTIPRGANVPTLAGITLTPNEKTTLNLTHSTKQKVLN